MIEEEPLPDWLARKILESYRLLVTDEPAPPVAVRSSATAEDTESASFAGMNETLLNVRGERGGARRGAELLVLAVRCAHRLLPRQEGLFGQADMDIAIVVQRQIEATRAG